MLGDGSAAPSCAACCAAASLPAKASAALHRTLATIRRCWPSLRFIMSSPCPALIDFIPWSPGACPKLGVPPSRHSSSLAAYWPLISTSGPYPFAAPISMNRLEPSREPLILESIKSGRGQLRWRDSQEASPSSPRSSARQVVIIPYFNASLGLIGHLERGSHTVTLLNSTALSEALALRDSN